MDESESPAQVVLACEAMKCRFELLLLGEDEGWLRSVGQEAIAEIRALDRQLNFFSPASEISRINREAHDRNVRVEPQLFRLLFRCRKLWQLTEGSFDPTVTPLLEAWGWVRREGRIPDASMLSDALSRTGMDKVELDSRQSTVRFLGEGASINLGSVGKGYALDRAREILREYGVGQALIHGGSSSVAAVGSPPGAAAWTVGVSAPSGEERQIAKVDLCGDSLAVSANHLNYLPVEGRRIGHVVDPRSGSPVEHTLLAAVVTGSAADADAFSTALLCAGSTDAAWLQRMSGALVVRPDGGIRVWNSGSPGCVSVVDGEEG